MNNGDFSYYLCTSCNWWILALACLSSPLTTDRLNNDDIYVTSNWWGQSWGRSSEPVRLTKFGPAPHHPPPPPRK